VTATSIIRPIDLGFEPAGSGGTETTIWRKSVRGRAVEFRLLRHLPELIPVDEIQREVFGVTDEDLVCSNELVVVPETGGEVIGAFFDGYLAGVIWGWGGFVNRRSRIVSDYMGVRKPFRSAGLGHELKRLQAAIGMERGFQEIVWTVDPLRAANGYLNFEKLGAYADHYEINRYGETFGAGIYGGIPTDRLHCTWPIDDPAVHAHLLGQTTALMHADLGGLPPFTVGIDVERALLELPNEIDAIMTTDVERARGWRMHHREILTDAFARGYAITGFVANTDPAREVSTYVLSKRGGGH
jgi:predicted GNAT superfamily acetyltransferase